jgi:ADP-ribose pyrophosphatase
LAPALLSRRTWFIISVESKTLMGGSWELLDSKKILEAGDGKATFMELFQDKVKTSKGQIVTYTRYNASDVVIVVPFLSDDRVVMIRQYRYPLDKVLLEFPAGHVEGGEDPGLTAKRELEEETGYSAGSIDYVYRYHPSVSRSNQNVHVFRASGLVAGKTRHDGGEDINVELLTTDILRQQIAQGKVESAGTLISYLLCCTDTVNKTERK